MPVPVLILAALLASQSAHPPVPDLVRLAADGWTAARQAALKGGAGESLAPARRAIGEIDRLTAGTTLRLQGEYAHALIAAAMAAAQDERGEMELQLAQARDLSSRLKASIHPAQWPLPIDEAAGELWLEVEQYAEAVRAYQRAVEGGAGARALLGLARSAARLGDARLACDSYRRWLAAPDRSGETGEARDYAARCP